MIVRLRWTQRMYGLDFIAAHMVGDYLLQTDAMARRKLYEWKIRMIHVSLYVLPFIFLTFTYRIDPGQQVTFLVLLWVTHFATDSRQWAHKAPWPPKAILVDQTIHLVTLAVLARLLVA